MEKVDRKEVAFFTCGMSVYVSLGNAADDEPEIDMCEAVGDANELENWPELVREYLAAKGIKYFAGDTDDRIGIDSRWLARPLEYFFNDDIDEETLEASGREYEGYEPPPDFD